MKQLMQLLRDNAQAQRRPLNLVRNDTGVTLYIYDIIDADWGVSARQVADALSGLAAGTPVALRINSPGGDVFEARAIHTLLSQHNGPVTAYVDSLAASAATTVALAAGQIVMAPGAYWMIHNAWSIAYGNKQDMTDMAALLDKMDKTIAADYMAKTGMSADQVAALMDVETWMTADEALSAKFCDAITAPGELDGDEDEPDDDEASARNSRRWNLSAYAKAPKSLTEPPAAPIINDQSVRENNARRLRLLSLG